SVLVPLRRCWILGVCIGWVGVAVGAGASELTASDVSTTGSELNPEPVVVPALQQWTPGKGRVSLRGAGITGAHNASAALGPVAQLLQQDLVAIGLAKETVKIAEPVSARSGIVLALGEAPPAESIAFPDQAYSIDIGDAVVIRAQTPTGIFYGTRTL